MYNCQKHLKIAQDRLIASNHESLKEVEDVKIDLNIHEQVLPTMDWSLSTRQRAKHFSTPIQTTADIPHQKTGR